MIVADASAVIDALLNPTGRKRLVTALSGRDERVAAPDLLDVEVLSVVRRWERGGRLETMRARQALDDLRLLPIVRYSATLLLEPAWRLRHTLSAYDAQYVSLAQLVGGHLLTSDRRMAEAARAQRVEIHPAGRGD